MLITILIIIITVAASLYRLAWYRFRAPDLSAFDTPVPGLMKEPEDISHEHEDVVLKKVAATVVPIDAEGMTS